MDKLKDCDAVTIAVRQRPLTIEEEENNEEKIEIKILPDNVSQLLNTFKKKLFDF